ncbi:hypothetical protein [Agrococcus jejuensis]|uniref:Uncharacterized protein n=1 Tax=Agrococcus jejuensis TaxID=399736 RepID=A0A1G8FSX8_9MICO|nr:hypothetical protein [Agrococcus jejuensis]SDH85268.1 hypothetical protein SAMN04489720_2606 [Agrococcus jejuensis]
MPDDDRDALSWDGDADDETLVTNEPEAPATTAAAASAAPAAVAIAADPAQRIRAVAGLLFLLIAIAAAVGWVVVMLENPAQQQTILGLAMYQLGELLAVLAPIGWWLAARRLSTQPVPWWIAGVVVTAPWPLLVGVLA